MDPKSNGWYLYERMEEYVCIYMGPETQSRHREEDFVKMEERLK